MLVALVRAMRGGQLQKPPNAPSSDKTFTNWDEFDKYLGFIDNEMIPWLQQFEAYARKCILVRVFRAVRRRR